MIAAFNKALVDVQKDGSLQAFIHKWDQRYGGMEQTIRLGGSKRCETGVTLWRRRVCGASQIGLFVGARRDRCDSVRVCLRG